MSYTEYINGANELYSSLGFPPYHWIKNITSPWTPFRIKLSDSRVALVAAEGISLRDHSEINSQILRK